MNMETTFKAKISKQGEHLIIFVPMIERDEFKHGDIVIVKKKKDV